MLYYGLVILADKDHIGEVVAAWWIQPKILLIRGINHSGLWSRPLPSTMAQDSRDMKTRDYAGTRWSGPGGRELFPTFTKPPLLQVSRLGLAPMLPHAVSGRKTPVSPRQQKHEEKGLCRDQMNGAWGRRDFPQKVSGLGVLVAWFAWKRQCRHRPGKWSSLGMCHCVSSLFRMAGRWAF